MTKQTADGKTDKIEDFPFQRIPAPLLLWYRMKKRDLPWRENRDPYRVWVSEIMLQQTRVEAAKEYYRRFLSELPDAAALAACDEDRLMKLWEGLGYYNRVRNLQKTARIVVERYGGRFPDGEKELRALPGIGEYTAGAIRSIAFGKRAAAVDGNVARVAARLSGDGSDASLPEFRVRVRRALEEIYPDEGRECCDFTQSLMELGALVCTPRSPDCPRCPLEKMCVAASRGLQSSLPVLPVGKEKRRERVFVFLIETADGFALRRRKTGVLKGLYEFPSETIGEERTISGEIGEKERAETERENAEEILRRWGVEKARVVRVGKYTHVFTHLRWDMTCFYVRAERSPFPAFSRERLEKEISLPTAFRQCAALAAFPD